MNERPPHTPGRCDSPFPVRIRLEDAKSPQGVWGRHRILRPTVSIYERRMSEKKLASSRIPRTRMLDPPLEEEL